MAKKKPDERDPVAREVDRLLRQLPGADPTLQTDPDQPPPQAARPLTTGARPVPPRPPGPLRAEPDAVQVWGVWGRVAGAAVLGGALTQWPYVTNCGWAVYGYLAAVGVLLLAAGWAAVAAWRHRVAPAHALALVVGFWGIVLAAEQILPRVGYAAETAVWRCVAPRAAPVAPPVTPAAAPVPASDSAALTGSAAGETPGQPQSVGRER